MNTDTVFISVVIISFNGLDFIEDCVSSVIDSLKGITYEVIVIDNASSDGTVQILQSQFPGVRLIQNEINYGFARAVNQGLAIAGGEYILILNQDTRIVDQAIVKLAERMRQDDTIGTIGPKFIGFDGKLQKCGRAFPEYRDLLWEFTGLSRLFPKSRVFSRWKMGWFDHLTEMEIDQPMGAALMVSRQAVKKVGDFDEGFGMFFNDVDFCRRIMENGYRKLYYPDAVIMHYVGGSTEKMKPKMVLESHRAMYRYFKKYSRGIRSLPGLYFWGLMLFIAAYIRAGLATIKRSLS